MIKSDLRITRTQKALCDSFIELANRKKFEDITINELCEGATIRRATFYNHFADKYDFFAFFVRQIQATLITEFSVLKQRTPEETTSDILCTYVFKKALNFFTEHIGFVNCLINSSAYSTLTDIIADEIKRNMLIYINDEKAKGKEYPFDLQIFSSFYSSGIISIITYWLKHRNTVTKEELYEEFKRLLAYNCLSNCKN